MIRTLVFFLLISCPGSIIAAEQIKLSIWDRGIKLTSPTDEDLFAYLWFYEWNMFDAVREGEHTGGTSDWKWGLVSTGTFASTKGDWFSLSATAVEDGAELLLKVTNRSNRSWPDIASIIPCFNPGFDDPGKTDAITNPHFLDDNHDHTYFYGEDGFDLLAGEAPREIHFNEVWLPAIESWDKKRDDGQFVWHHKWPTSKRNAHRGLLARESEDRSQTMAIVWEDFLTLKDTTPGSACTFQYASAPLSLVSPSPCVESCIYSKARKKIYRRN